MRPAFDGDQSPAKSGENSPHSEVFGCGFAALRLGALARLELPG